MVCLETDFLVAFLRNDKEAVKKAEELASTEGYLSITPITATELLRGAFLSDKKENIGIVEELISSFQFLNYDIRSARKAGELFYELGEKGQPIGQFDTLIAAIAMSHGEAILTRNVKHFGKIEGLVLKKW